MPQDITSDISALRESIWNKGSSASYRHCDSIHFGLLGPRFPGQVPRGSTQLPALQAKIVKFIKDLQPDIRFSSMILNRYHPGDFMGRHNDHNLANSAWQVVCVWGKFKGGELVVHGSNAQVIYTQGIFLLDGNIDHEVYPITIGTRYSLVTYNKHIPNALQYEQLISWGYDLPPSPSMSTMSDLPILLRFWFSREMKMPSPEDLRTAMTWTGFHQVVYTNLPAESWIGFTPTEKTIKPLTGDILPTEEFVGIAPQFLKDVWQFQMSQYWDGALCVDFDFHLLDRSLLPTTDIILISEPVKVSSSLAPRDVLKVGCRLHLGISKFPKCHPIGLEIYNLLRNKLPRLANVCKGHARWMDNTKIAQKVVQEHGLQVCDPLIFIPFPFWMKRAHFGSLHYGTHLPTISQCLVGSACFNTWSGFPEFALKDVAEGLSSTLPSPIEIPVPDDDELIEAFVILHISLIEYRSILCYMMDIILIFQYNDTSHYPGPDHQYHH